MANPRPTPKPENLHPPWPPGTSGNPAGYSRGRRIGDAIERLIEEMALDREFGATAIAMAAGKKYMLKRKVKDPEIGKEIWVEHKPDIAWFNMILERIEPVAKQTDDTECWRPWEMTTTANFPPGSIKAKLLDRLQRSRSDPCYFNEKVLCRSPYWRAQREWASALVDHRIVAVETGNMLGKGFLIGELVP